MNELRATRGPWELVEVPRGFIVTADERSYDIAIVWNLGYHDNKANAALIAASPAMYEEIKYHLEMTRLMPNGEQTADFKRMDALLKKARGEA